MDVLNWDCAALDNEDTGDKFPCHLFADDREYDLTELNCCILRDAYRGGDVMLWGRILAHWDKMRSNSKFSD